MRAVYRCELIMTIAFVRAEIHVRQQAGARGIVCDSVYDAHINPGKYVGKRLLYCVHLSIFLMPPT